MVDHETRQLQGYMWPLWGHLNSDPLITEVYGAVTDGRLTSKRAIDVALDGQPIEWAEAFGRAV